MKKGFSYDDVLIKPSKTSVTDLSQVDISTLLGDLELEIPMVSAPMDTVTETELARKIAQEGGLGIIHRFMPIDEQVLQVEKVKKSKVFDSSATDENGNLLVGAAVGLFDQDRVNHLIEANIDSIVIDIAHGHHERLLNELESYSRKYSDITWIAGNVATVKGAEDLFNAGADVVKVGIGPGSACTTREMTGAGVPQFTAVKEVCNKIGGSVIADGGIRKPGDLVKALMAGADAGMLGGMFAGTDEAPGEMINASDEKYKVFRGMSSTEAAKKRAEREGKEISYEDRISEGVNSRVEYKGGLKEILDKFKGGLRSGISYCGEKNLDKARKNAEFIEISNSTQARNPDHASSL